MVKFKFSLSLILFILLLPSGSSEVTITANDQENLVFVKESTKPGLYEFENLTFVPFDTRLIDKTLMTAIELNWLNEYHKEVFDKISPLVSGNTLMWVKSATQPL